ncbi:phage tail assembly chaperone [Pseudomonas chlororaphis]|uniref:phage tail assembly chaperone n=1 Tax=Pseudomonas chlororaphis TaxID=587753 RepID=UPI002366A061|nr:phage tail assembly chaperone [Pseudomonas chlororaphis]WDH24130.1 phage tail assembly chaperone [Pseudomonas chlororaphis]
MAKYLYSATTGGVYLTGFHSDIPGDALEISNDVYRQCFAQPLPAGKIVVPGDDGLPSIVDQPKTSAEAIVAAERVWRNQNLSLTDSLVARHRDEQEAGSGTTLDKDRYAELQAYRSALRSWPETSDFPTEELRPAAPTWMLEQLQ